MAPNQKHPEPTQPQAAPVPPQTPYQQQPVEQQYFAQPQAAPVQYVVAAQSLKGLRGWLLFFTIIAGLASVGYISIFINSVSDFSTDVLASVIFAPVLLALSVSAVVLTVLEKKIARFAFVAYYSVSVIYSLINSIVAGAEVAAIMSSLLVGILVVGFLSLYFFKSKRVMETLVK